MKFKLHRRLAALLAAVSLLFFALACSKSEEPPTQGTPSIQANGSSSGVKKAFDFKAKTLDGSEFSLSSLKGKVVLLDFWATWCPPCQASVPHLVELQKKYGDKGLVVVGLSMDTSFKDVQAFLKKQPVNYRIAQCPETAREDYKISGIPRMFVIDREGAIRGDFLGFSPQIGENIESALAAALNR